MLEGAMHDALVVTWAAKYCYQRLAPGSVDPTLQPVVQQRASPSYPSEHAALAGVIQTILPVFFPPNEEAEGFDGIALAVAESRVVGGGNYRSDVDAGLAIGRAVGQAVLAARANDGATQASAPVTVPTGPCLWAPTAPNFRQQPVEAGWGLVTPFLMSSGDQFRPPPPPACGSSDFNAQTRDVYEVSQTLTARQKAIAFYWAGGQGTETPPGMWLWIGLNETIEHDLTTMQTARVMSHTAAALADAAIAAWDTKFTYWWERPITTIRRDIDPNWHTTRDGPDDHRLDTPPFPGYVSGHSTFAGAATTTLMYFFPDATTELSAYATEAALSRYYGGIHIRSDNEIGLVVGTNIAGLAIQRASLSAET
jgi:membrane-associated phospholipid phosphatase